MFASVRPVSVSLVILALCAINRQVSAEVVLIGAVQFAGSATDASALVDTLADGVPHNRLGGISAIEYTRQANRYLVLSDRGPGDGACDYACRFHLIDLLFDPGGSRPAFASLVSTTLLRDDQKRSLSGARAQLPAGSGGRERFDPEGIRQTAAGRLIIADEYGPALAEFSIEGRRLRDFSVPARFRIDRPAADPDDENKWNARGRQANGGFEGLAITPDGSRLYAMAQRPLIQDSQPNSGRKLRGSNVRLVEFAVDRGSTREFQYGLDDPTYGVSEILAVNAHQFLVLERDGKPGSKAVNKKIYLIDIRGATDVSLRDALPPAGQAPGIQPVEKKLFLDLLQPQYGLVGPACPDKFEGLAFGPDLSDGRRLLIVAVDNDYLATSPTWFYGFGIDRDDLANFGW
ncbi:MAG: esterase-like activity of phytase family protein [Planctomycetaceae bacterium]